MLPTNLPAMPGLKIEPNFRSRCARLLPPFRGSLRVLLLVFVTAMARAPALAGPMVTLEAGLAQSAGAQFLIDPTALSFRIEASSSGKLTALVVTVNARDVTSRLLALGRLSVASDGSSGSLVAERLGLVSLGIAGAGTYRVVATVSDTTGDTTIEATLSTGGIYAPVALTTLAQGSYSGIRATTRTVVRDQESWEALWRAHTSNLIPAPPAPAVDFASQTVLAVVMGEQPSGGYGVVVTKARARTANTPLTVLVRETRPSRDDIVTLALTSPFHFVVMPLWTGAVRFVVVDEPIAP